MAECQKKNSSSVSLKEKGDLDLGKDFFSSWKPMSMADGDGMDFDLTPGNKKPFNFDKASSCASFSLEVSNLAQSSGNPTTLATKNTCNEGLEISSIELGRKPPDLSGLKLQGLNFDSRNFRIQKDIKPVGNIAIFPNLQKQTPHTLSTKRKTLELLQLLLKACQGLKIKKFVCEDVDRDC